MRLLRRAFYMYLLGIVTITPFGYLVCAIIGDLDKMTVTAVLFGATSFVVCDLLEEYWPIAQNR